jgi:hypothetical protein
MILHDIARLGLTMPPPDLPKPLLVSIAGPYLSGTQGDLQKISANRARLESFALPIYRRGHLPMVGEWLALPITIYTDVAELPRRLGTRRSDQ